MTKCFIKPVTEAFPSDGYMRRFDCSVLPLYVAFYPYRNRISSRRMDVLYLGSRYSLQLYCRNSGGFSPPLFLHILQKRSVRLQHNKQIFVLYPPWGLKIKHSFIYNLIR